MIKITSAEGSSKEKERSRLVAARSWTRILITFYLENTATTITGDANKKITSTRTIQYYI